MNSDQVVDKIVSEAKENASQINAQADGELAKIENSFNKNLNDYQAKSKTLADDAAADKSERMLATARMKSAKETLTAKISVIDEVFAKSIEKIKSLDDAGYKDFILSLLGKLNLAGDETIVAANGETRIDNSLVESFNSSSGKTLTLSTETCQGQAGFILTRGKVSINCTNPSTNIILRIRIHITLSKPL